MGDAFPFCFSKFTPTHGEKQAEDVDTKARPLEESFGFQPMRERDRLQLEVGFGARRSIQHSPWGVGVQAGRVDPGRREERGETTCPIGFGR